MKASQIQVGQTYIAKISGQFAPVRVDTISNVRAHTSYECTNLKTGRKIHVRSAAKFRRPYTRQSTGLLADQQALAKVIQVRTPDNEQPERWDGLS